MADSESEFLCEAARSGDSAKVKQLIDSGADICYFDPNGLTPLMYAAKHGHADVVKILLESGAPWNALSPSNLSAGDFAMDAGHQDAFEVLLNAGIQAELLLGTITRSENKNVDSDGDYLEDRVTFSEDKLMDSSCKAVMMAWEKPLMEAHAKAVCSGGGHILNIGFGMGLVDMAIQQYSPVSHTIVEAHPEVYDRMLRDGWGKKDNVKIIFGRWQDVISQLETYDGIFFDTYGEYYEDLRTFHQKLPSLLKPDGIYSFFNGLCGGTIYCNIALCLESWRVQVVRCFSLFQVMLKLGLAKPKMLLRSCQKTMRRNHRYCSSLVALDQAEADGQIDAVDDDKKDDFSYWVPHPRNGIYYPKGNERVMDDVPVAAASFEQPYWLRSEEGVEKPSPDDCNTRIQLHTSM